MPNLLISYSDKQIKDLVDESTNLRIVRTLDKTQFYTKNLFRPDLVLVLDTSIINDKEFIEWALLNTRLDLILLAPDSSLKIDLKALKKKHKVQVIEREPLPKDGLFVILDQIMKGRNRLKVKALLQESVGLFPLILKWLIGSHDLFNEWNQKVIEEIDEKYMRRNVDAIIRNLAFGIQPEDKFIRFKWVFPKMEDKKGKK